MSYICQFAITDDGDRQVPFLSNTVSIASPDAVYDRSEALYSILERLNGHKTV